MKKIKQAGYTLVELLAVMIVLITVGTVIVVIMVVALRTGSKTGNIEAVRQNGNYVISQIAKEVEFAKQFDGVSSSFASGYSCGSVMADKNYLKITDTDTGISTVFQCGAANLTKKVGSGTANELIGGQITVGNCSFSCIQNSIYEPPLVKIHLELSSTLSAPGISGIIFEQIVSPRNYQH